MKNMSRSIRRHHVQRLKNNRKNYYGYHRVYGTKGIQQMTPKRLGMVVKYPASCSCPSCGNPRNHFGTLTKQEMIHMYDFNVRESLLEHK